LINGTHHPQPVPAERQLLIKLATGGFSRLQKFMIFRCET